MLALINATNTCQTANCTGYTVIYVIYCHGTVYKIHINTFSQMRYRQQHDLYQKVIIVREDVEMDKQTHTVHTY